MPVFCLDQQPLIILFKFSRLSVLSGLPFDFHRRGMGKYLLSNLLLISYLSLINFEMTPYIVCFTPLSYCMSYYHNINSLHHIRDSLLIPLSCRYTVHSLNHVPYIYTYTFLSHKTLKYFELSWSMPPLSFLALPILWPLIGPFLCFLTFHYF